MGPGPPGALLYISSLDRRRLDNPGNGEIFYRLFRVARPSNAVAVLDAPRRIAGEELDQAVGNDGKLIAREVEQKAPAYTAPVPWQTCHEW